MLSFEGLPSSSSRHLLNSSSRPSSVASVLSVVNSIFMGPILSAFEGEPTPYSPPYLLTFRNDEGFAAVHPSGCVEMDAPSPTKG